MNSKELIEQLTKEIGPQAAQQPLRSPGYYALRLVLVLLVYGVTAESCQELRPDVIAQLGRPAYLIEILLLAMLSASSAVAAILSMYPDAYQKKRLLKLPYYLSGAFILFMAAQLFLPADPMMIIPPPGGHSIECAICVASVAFIPSALIFALLRKGASVSPIKAGSFAVLAATGLSCLTLRLAEDNDSIRHLLLSHYMPTLLFAMLGAFIGKRLLRW